MIRGVTYRVPQATTDTLWQMLKCIDVEKYYWYNIRYQEEAYLGTISPREMLFGAELYDGESFSQIVRQDHFIIFVKLQAYLSMNISNISNISTYEDFQQSDCQMLLLIWDCEWVDIYAKEQYLIDSLYQNALSNGYTEIKYITDDNDDRTGMDLTLCQ